MKKYFVPFSTLPGRSLYNVCVQSRDNLLRPTFGEMVLVIPDDIKVTEEYDSRVGQTFVHLEIKSHDN